MSCHINPINRTQLLCPVRGCILPLQAGMFQNLFCSHTMVCQKQTFVTKLRSPINYCALGHIMTTKTAHIHKICTYLGSSSHLYAPQLKLIVGSWTVIPYAFKSPLTSLQDCAKMVFDETSSSLAATQANKAFIDLLYHTAKRMEKAPLLCPICIIKAPASKDRSTDTSDLDQNKLCKQMLISLPDLKNHKISENVLDDIVPIPNQQLCQQITLSDQDLPSDAALLEYLLDIEK